MTCNKNGCEGTGYWVPLLTVHNIDRSQYKTTEIKWETGIPLILCDRCKGEATPAKLLDDITLATIIAGFVDDKFEPDPNTVDLGWRLLTVMEADQYDKLPTQPVVEVTK